METNDNNLRGLIRLLPPARALAQTLEKSLHLETYAGTGDSALRGLEGLRASVAQLTNDPYIAALTTQAGEGATDKEKVSVALLAASQLAAYLEGQTGLVGLGGQDRGNHYQTAPNVHIGPLGNIPGDIARSALGMGERAMQEKGTAEAEA